MSLIIRIAMMLLLVETTATAVFWLERGEVGVFLSTVYSCPEDRAGAEARVKEYCQRAWQRLPVQSYQRACPSLQEYQSMILLKEVIRELSCKRFDEAFIDRLLVFLTLSCRQKGIIIDDQHFCYFIKTLASYFYSYPLTKEDVCQLIYCAEIYVGFKRLVDDKRDKEDSCFNVLARHRDCFENTFCVPDTYKHLLHHNQPLKPFILAAACVNRIMDAFQSKQNSLASYFVLAIDDLYQVAQTFQYIIFSLMERCVAMVDDDALQENKSLQRSCSLYFSAFKHMPFKNALLYDNALSFDKAVGLLAQGYRFLQNDVIREGKKYLHYITYCSGMSVIDYLIIHRALEKGLRVKVSIILDQCSLVACMPGSSLASPINFFTRWLDKDYGKSQRIAHESSRIEKRMGTYEIEHFFSLDHFHSHYAEEQLVAQHDHLGDYLKEGNALCLMINMDDHRQRLLRGLVSFWYPHSGLYAVSDNSIFSNK